MQKIASRSKMVKQSPRLQLKSSHLMIAAAFLHILLTIFIYLIGRFGLLPSTFNAYGIGVSFAGDCVGYRLEAVSLIETLIRRGIVEWLAASSEFLINPFHIKLYSLSFAVFGPWLGYNILSAEPLNLVCYLLILYLVFSLGKEVFDRWVGILAAVIVALWPSFLLHTTQLLRDPLFIVGILALILTCSRWLTRDYSWSGNLVNGAIGGIAVCLLWVIRGQMQEVLLAIILLGASLLVIKQVREGRLQVGNLVSAAFLLLIIVSLPQISEIFRRYTDPADHAPITVSRTEATLPVPSLQMDSATTLAKDQPRLGTSGLPGRISYLRHGFITTYPLAGSNIDTNVEFASIGDIISYLPRAMGIGFFSPFPNMWLVPGVQVGLSGRLLSGIETLIMYIIELLAAFGLLRARQQVSAWLLLLGAAVGVTALGLVVANVGTLYRMRYSFWILLIILGASGMVQIFSLWAWKED